MTWKKTNQQWFKSVTSDWCQYVGKQIFSLCCVVVFSKWTVLTFCPSAAGDLWPHPDGRASSALCGAGCTGLSWNVAEKRALTGQPGILHSLHTQTIAFLFPTLSVTILLINWYMLFHMIRSTTIRMSNAGTRCTIKTLSCFRLVAVRHWIVLTLSPFTCYIYAYSMMIYDPSYKLFTDSCFQHGTQPLPHADLVEIWALWLFQWELFKQRPGKQHCSTHEEKDVVLPPNTPLSDDNKLNLQDELTQWNRLTEEMLYLLIVIVGTV